MSQETLNFDLDVVEIAVAMGERNYILREANGDAACKYRNASIACTKLGPEGNAAGFRNLADVEPLLVSLCLFEVITDDKGTFLNHRPVQEGQIRKWPARVQKGLFNKAKEISDLGEVEEDLESLTKQREELDKRIKELEEDESSSKKEQNDMMVGSD